MHHPALPEKDKEDKESHGQKNRSPKLPETIPQDGNGEYNTVFSRNIKKYFPPLRVNDMGMCDICQKYWRDK